MQAPNKPVTTRLGGRQCHTQFGSSTTTPSCEAHGDRLPILFISGERKDSFDRVAGLLIGADDYLCKPFAPDELVARVNRLVEREPPRSAPSLTPRELQVLRSAGRREAAARDRGRARLSPKTVGTHIEHILSKLGVRSRTQAVALAYRDGLLDAGREPVGG